MSKSLILFVASISLFVVATIYYGLWDANSKKENVTAEKAVRTVAERELKLHRVTKTPFKMDADVAKFCRAALLPQAPHDDAFCHVYVSESGIKVMETGVGIYPEGTVIVKQKYSDDSAKETDLFTLMRKMGDQYDPDFGNWEYSIVDADGKTVVSRGRTESCQQCHQRYTETDWVTRAYMTN